MQVLCARALDLALSFDELMSEFPDGSPDDEYLAIAYEDLVDGVEHVPGNLFGKVDVSAWRNSDMYAALALHVLLLGGAEPLNKLLHLYRLVRSHDPISVENLPQLVSEARHKAGRRGQ